MDVLPSACLPGVLRESRNRAIAFRYAINRYSNISGLPYYIPTYLHTQVGTYIVWLLRLSGACIHQVRYVANH